MGFFQDLFGDTSAKAARDAAATKVAGYNQAFTAQQPYYNTAVADVTGGYGDALSKITGYLGSSGIQGGSNLYADLTGANGPEGQARARAAFQTDPGYDFAREQALQATQRATGTGG